MKITKAEINAFWKFYWILMFKWFGRSFLAFISTAVIWDFISKNYLGSKKWYSSMNDTEDGDFGGDWWLKKHGYKKGIWSAFVWWLRNHSWNYIRQFIPLWRNGEVDDFLVIKNNLTKVNPDEGKFTRASKENGIYGIKSIAYRIDGQVFCQWSFANWFITLQLGAGGSEYRFRMRLL